MSIQQAVILGIVQGATEFLPVSSSGHLIIARELLEMGEIPLLFDVMLHFATLAAVLIVLRTRIGLILRALIHGIQRKTVPEDIQYIRLFFFLLVSTGITAVVGIGLEMLFDFRQPQRVSVLFLCTAILLLFTVLVKGGRSLKQLQFADSVLIGIAQGFGVLPGISRSGITISVGLYKGMDRTAAGEYAFLLSIPAILGALLLTARDMGDLTRQIGVSAVLIGCFAAFLVGVATLSLLLRLIKQGRLYVFALYLFPLGLWGLFRFLS